MEKTKWRYYQHVVMPVCAPHETPDVTEVYDGTIWKRFPKAIMATWTSDFDCGYDTGWWVIIKDDAPYSVEGLEYSNRKKVRKAERNCYVKIIDPTEYAQQLAEVYYNAAKRYKHKKLKKEKDLIRGFCNPHDRVYWGGFDRSTDKLIGYLTTVEHGQYVDIPAAKFSADYLKLLVSDAIYSAFLSYYLNEKKVKYISTGFRSIQHATNTQDYEIRHFGFRKAFVKLHVEINPKYKTLIRFLYSVRGLLRLGILDKIGIIHRINGVLTMKEIAEKANQSNEKNETYEE